MARIDFVAFRQASESPSLHPVVKKVFDTLDERRIMYEEIEQKVGVSGATLWNWRKGKTSPKFFLLVCVMDYLGLEIAVHEKQGDS